MHLQEKVTASQSVVTSARLSSWGSRASSLPSANSSFGERSWTSWAKLFRQLRRVSHIFCSGDHIIDYFENTNHWLWSETINSCRNASWRRKLQKKKIHHYRQTSCQNYAVWTSPLWWVFFWFWASCLSAFIRNVQKNISEGNFLWSVWSTWWETQWCRYHLLLVCHAEGSPLCVHDESWRQSRTFTRQPIWKPLIYILVNILPLIF